MAVRIKRVYEAASPKDGRRILVDRVWPRGISKKRANVDQWIKAVAPSTDLRKWFGHDPKKWTEFKKRYAAELDQGPPELEQLIEWARERTLTLVYSASDTEHNQAVALRGYLERASSRPR